MLDALCGFLESRPTFTALLKDLTVPEKASVTLECELSKSDQKVKWLKEDQEIKPDRTRGVVVKVDGRRHSLTIPQAGAVDSAEYTVKCGEEQTKGRLSVEGRMLLEDLLCHFYIFAHSFSGCDVPALATCLLLELTLTEIEPTFVVPLDDVAVTEETDVSLECELSAPEQKVTWLKNDKPVKPDKRRGVAPKAVGRKHSLSLPRATPEDSADYTVKCGDTQTTAKVTVNSKFKYQAATLLRIFCFLLHFCGSIVFL